MYAAFYGHERLAAKLLQCGASIDLQNRVGLTALMFAAFKDGGAECGVGGSGEGGVGRDGVGLWGGSGEGGVRAQATRCAPKPRGRTIPQARRAINCH